MKKLITAGILGLALVATGPIAAFAYNRDYNTRQFSSYGFEDDFWGSWYGNYWSYRYWWY